MVNEFCGFKHGVIGTDKMPADTTLNNMKKSDLIKLLHTAQHNYENLMWFYNNAVNANMAQLNNNGWIACSERLPEEDERVLCLHSDDFIDCGVLIGETWCCDMDEYSVIAGDVYAWQPLPASYRLKGNETVTSCHQLKMKAADNE